MSATSSNSSLHLALYYCFDSRDLFFIFSSFFITKILFLFPLCICTFYLGYQRWRRQRSATSISHSDFFAYHMAVMELNGLVFFLFFFCGAYIDLKVMEKVGFHVCYMVFPGEMFFHILTCVERYLAVVHPIIYLGLKQSAGVRIRSISVGCVWLLCCGWIGVTVLYDPDLPYSPFFCILAFSLMVVSFCSLSVLRVLIRPGPGEVRRDEERVDQTKQRAFNTIMATLGVLGLWFFGLLVCVALERSRLLSHRDGCLLIISGVWFTLPSSLVLPLLFLHRAGKLQYSCYSNE